MKRMKKAISMVMVMVLLLTCAAVVSEKKTEAASTYWMTGGGGISHLKFKNGKFKMTGKWGGKASTLDKSVSKYYSKTKTVNKTFKRGAGLKTGGIDENGMDYDASPQLSGELVGITCSVKIKKGKIVRIINSAM